MHVQRPAAALAFRDHHFAAIFLQHPHGGLVETGERNIGHAAGQERDPVAPRAAGGKRAADLAEEERRLGRRRERLHISQASQQLENSQCPDQRLEAASFVQIQKRAGDGQGCPRRQQAPERQVAREAREDTAGRAPLDLRARRLHQAPVLHARRAGRLAAPAGQAQADVLQIGAGDRRAIGNLHHLVDAAARRIHLQTELAVGRAGVETQAAMHAAVQVDLLRSIPGPGFFR